MLTPDGKYYGWELSPGSDVYGVIYESIITGWLWATPSLTTKTYITAYWSMNGFASTDRMNNKENCYSSISRGAEYYSRKGDNTLYGQLKYGVYVDSVAPKAGNYNLNFFIGKQERKFARISQPINVILNECTITTPGLIRFGTLDAGSTTPVVSPDGGLDIVCSGQSTTLNLSETVHAVSALQSSTELILSNIQNQEQAVVRGFISSGTKNDGVCHDTTTSLHFDSTTTTLEQGAANNQSHRFPLQWVLCPKRGVPPGKGTASATLIINWN